MSDPSKDKDPSSQLPRSSWQDQKAFNEAAAKAKESLDQAESAANINNSANPPHNPMQSQPPLPPAPAYGGPPRQSELILEYGGPPVKPYDPNIHGPVPMPAYGGPMRRRMNSAANQKALLIGVGAGAFIAGFLFFFTQSWVITIAVAVTIYIVVKFLAGKVLNR